MDITATPTHRSAALTRPVHDRLLTGVTTGLADFLGLDVTVVRIAVAVLVIASGIGIPLYLAAWLLIPETGAEDSIAGGFVRSHRRGRV